MKLAYDVGVYDGADTAHYLALGYRVIGVEASPDLCKILRQRFSKEIDDGRYTLINVAIGESEGVLPFWLSENPQWNSFDYAAATRDGKTATQISVPTRQMADVIREHGTPDYLKVDIEGMDYACIRGMGAESPTHLSFEAWEHGCDEILLELAARGYTQFSLVQQRTMRPVIIPRAGSIGHIQWSVRSWLRWQLRNHPVIHKAIAGTRSSLRWAAGRRLHRKAPESVPLIHPCLTPMEHADGWYSIHDFMWLWRNIISSGMIDSTWFDVHASRPLPASALAE
jgi:FkbM family methyltransferase